MKRIINGIIIFVVCVGIGAFSIINNKDTKQVLKQSDNNVKVEEVSNNEIKSENYETVEVKEQSKTEEIKTEKNTEQKKKETLSNTTSKKEEPKVEVSETKPVVTQSQTNTVPENKVEQQTTQTTTTTKPAEQKNSSCGIYQSITNCMVDYDSSSACYSAGDRLTEMYLNDLMDYNELNPDNPKSREIQNTECYSVDTDNGVKWFLLVVCYNNYCSQNYKSIYLGK